MVNNTTTSVDVSSVACDLFPDRSDYCTVLLHCKRTSAALSIIGSVFTIVVIWLFRKYKEFAQRMILHVCAAALLLAIFYSLTDIEPTPGALCSIQAAGMTFSAWAIMLWVLIIVLNLFLIVERNTSLEKYERRCLAACWLIPLVVAVLPFADDAYAPAGAWCWIKNIIAWRYGLWYAWNMISVVIVFVVIIHVICYLRRHTDERDGRVDPSAIARKQALRDDARTLRFYPVVYFIVRLFNTINRIQNTVAGVHKQDEYNFPLLLLQTIMVPFFGAAIAVVFVLDRRTLRVLTPTSIKTTLMRRLKRTHIQEMSETRMGVATTGADTVISDGTVAGKVDGPVVSDVNVACVNDGFVISVDNEVRE